MIDCSVSIIIPAYNVEKYLKAALDSIKEQTELPDEVILIDDGSSDSTLAVAKAFALPVPYQVVSVENGGQGNARNLGVSLASSEYVYFFDSDDLLTKNFVSTIKDQIRYNQRPDIILFSGESFNDSEYQGNRCVDYSRGFSGVFSDRAQFLDKALSQGALFCSPCLYVSKIALWGPEGLEFGPNFLEDEALFYPVIFACSTYVVIDEVHFLRRNRDGSTMTMAPNAKHVNGALNCMETTLSLYSFKSLATRERWHIRKRLGSHCVVYIVTARRAGLPVRVGEVVSTIVKSRSVSLAVKALLYGLRADQSDTVRKISRAVKRVGGFASG
ncbi:glycosyltransferase family 2 protein [Halomonas korlensis]|uniref:Glycosyltransferase involved in cell wall bisynthesis n=1 Tax=Halomonas korlensis TaxID=463301 RepID=A0A1I7KDR0_9GAMM|nr:glycosyltransferase family 2 protein [Halomonas korlensis]SFU95516.1 Glycosyltransferase involved in cell wall bisynthesis [Halomonas korlensis]